MLLKESERDTDTRTHTEGEREVRWTGVKEKVNSIDKII